VAEGAFGGCLVEVPTTRPAPGRLRPPMPSSRVAVSGASRKDLIRCWATRRSRLRSSRTRIRSRTASSAGLGTPRASGPPTSLPSRPPSSAPSTCPFPSSSQETSPRGRGNRQSRLPLGDPARNLAVSGEEGTALPRFLIHGRDAKYSGPFDEAFRTKGASVIHTPIRVPRANAFAERWVRTVRTECLDWTLVRGRRHPERVLRTYTKHYNAGRPHPVTRPTPPARCRRDPGRSPPAPSSCPPIA